MPADVEARIQSGAGMNRYFVIMAHARSGSTLLCRKLETLVAGRVFQEIFHNDMNTIYRHLYDSADQVERAFRPLSGKDLREHLASAPLDYLEFLSAINPGQEIFFKVFPGHLMGEARHRLLKASAGVIVLERNLLHSFISAEIAMRKKKFNNFDTSNEKIAFSVDRFIDHMSRISAFYEDVAQAIQNLDLPSAAFSYEAISDPEGGDSLLRSEMKALGVQMAQEERASDTLAVVDVRRQDVRTLASDKVTNPEVLLKFLSEHGLAEADDASRPVPVQTFVGAIG